MVSSARHVTHDTPKKRALFLDSLITCGNVTAAAKAAGIQRRQVYRLRAGDPEFAAAWDEAAELGIDALEDEARRRAHDGVDEALTCAKGLIYDADGVPVTVRKYSDTLMIFLLKGARPEKYRERTHTEITGKDGGPIETRQGQTVALDLDALTDDQIVALRAVLNGSPPL